MLLNQKKKKSVSYFLRYSFVDTSSLAILSKIAYASCSAFSYSFRLFDSPRLVYTVMRTKLRGKQNDTLNVD